MKQTLCILILLSFQLTHAMRVNETIRVTPENCKELGFTITVNEDKMIKSCYDVKIIAPKKAKNESLISYASLSINKNKKSLLHACLEIKRKDKDHHEILFGVAKDNLDHASMSLLYYVRTKEVTWDPESFYYEISFKDFKPKK